MKLNFENIIIDPEFESLLPAPSDREKELLEEDLLLHGLQTPLIVWEEPETKEYIIIDGHNRYEIIKNHRQEIWWNAEKDFRVMSEGDLPTREAVKLWILKHQLGKRNVVSLQKIKMAEEFRPTYEELARLNKSSMGGDRKSHLLISARAIPYEKRINVRKKLAEIAGVSEDTYSKGKKIWDFGDEQLIDEVLTGRKTINAVYKIIQARENNVEVQEEPTETNADSAETKSKNVRELEKKLDSFFNGLNKKIVKMEGNLTKAELETCINLIYMLTGKLMDATDQYKNMNTKAE